MRIEAVSRRCMGSQETVRGEFGEKGRDGIDISSGVMDVTVGGNYSNWEGQRRRRQLYSELLDWFNLKGI